MSEVPNARAGALKQHRLFRIATIYVVAGWISIQVADIVLEAFESPVWIMQTFLILVLAGLPVTLTCLWLIERSHQSGTSKSLVSVATIALGRLEEAQAAITKGRRIRPDLSLDLMQNYFGVSRPAVDARRNTALRRAGLE